MIDNELKFTSTRAQKINKRIQITHPKFAQTKAPRTQNTIIEFMKVLPHQHNSASDEQIFLAVRQYNSQYIR